jgi:hypothetical protein
MVYATISRVVGSNNVNLHVHMYECIMHKATQIPHSGKHSREFFVNAKSHIDRWDQGLITFGASISPW